MNRILLMVLRNIFVVPRAYWKLCHYAKNTDKYTEEERQGISLSLAVEAFYGVNQAPKSQEEFDEWCELKITELAKRKEKRKLEDAERKVKREKARVYRRTRNLKEFASKLNLHLTTDKGKLKGNCLNVLSRPVFRLWINKGLKLTVKTQGVQKSFADDEWRTEEKFNEVMRGFEII